VRLWWIGRQPEPQFPFLSRLGGRVRHKRRLGVRAAVLIPLFFDVNHHSVPIKHSASIPTRMHQLRINTELLGRYRIPTLMLSAFGNHAPKRAAMCGGCPRSSASSQDRIEALTKRPP
jgi:hypothetical protein